MKALSIKQPFASLIVLGIKDIENRTWYTNYRGRIYVHASAKPAKSLISSCLTLEQCEVAGIELRKTIQPLFNNTKQFPHSAIIGEVDIIDCIPDHTSIWSEHNTTKKKIIYGKEITIDVPVFNWVLANPVKYRRPILNVNGKLSFWEFNDINIIK